MVGRGEVTDLAWARIAPLLPKNPPRGGRWSDHRKILNGILWRERTGAPWPDLPDRYGPWQTVYNRFRRWSLDGTWDRILTEVVVKNDAVGEVEWEISIDATVIRAHQHAAGAPHRVPKDQKGTLPSTHAPRTNAPRWKDWGGPEAD
jgi:transposase